VITGVLPSRAVEPQIQHDDVLRGGNPVTDIASIESLDKVYGEAGQWVRLCNTIVWQMAAVFIPASATCIGLALLYRRQMAMLAIASIVFFSIWVFVSFLYGRTAIDARDALMAIERHWRVPGQMALYTLHRHPGRWRFSLFRVQIVTLACLVIFWIVLARWIEASSN
jgi:hypothetical protein